jgi:hypothetical protein
VTNRANLQVRAFPGAEGRLAAEALAAVESTGLVPTRSHELVRNGAAGADVAVASVLRGSHGRSRAWRRYSAGV